MGINALDKCGLTWFASVLGRGCGDVMCAHPECTMRSIGRHLRPVAMPPPTNQLRCDRTTHPRESTTTHATCSCYVSTSQPICNNACSRSSSSPIGQPTTRVCVCVCGCVWCTSALTTYWSTTWNTFDCSKHAHFLKSQKNRPSGPTSASSPTFIKTSEIIRTLSLRPTLTLVQTSTLIFAHNHPKSQSVPLGRSGPRIWVVLTNLFVLSQQAYGDAV